MSFILFTDSNSDIPYQDAVAHDIKICYMPYTLDGEEQVSDLGRGDAIPRFYAAMRSGKTPTTSLLTPARYIEYFEPYLALRKDILFICFPSTLSGTFDSAQMARRELMEKYPERRLEILDSCNISMGQAWVAVQAARLRDEGRTMDETIEWVETNKYNVRYWFTVDDLVYLKRSGRISATTATVGSLLNIKPMLTVNRDGRLASVSKQKGRKKAIRQLVTNMMEEIVDPENQVITILQADCMDDAQVLADILTEQLPGIRYRIEKIGPTICTHAGPGTLAVQFIGQARDRT